MRQGNGRPEKLRERRETTRGQKEQTSGRVMRKRRKKASPPPSNYNYNYNYRRNITMFFWFSSFARSTVCLRERGFVRALSFRLPLLAAPLGHRPQRGRSLSSHHILTFILSFVMSVSLFVCPFVPPPPPHFPPMMPHGKNGEITSICDEIRGHCLFWNQCPVSPSYQSFY
jgi:hypothetical protein